MVFALISDFIVYNFDFKQWVLIILSLFFIYHPSAYISRDHSHDFVIASHDISFFLYVRQSVATFFSSLLSFLFFVAFSYFLSYFLFLFSFLDEIKKSIV